jgi:hypothetical protein
VSEFGWRLLIGLLAVAVIVTVVCVTAGIAMSKT